MLYKFKKLTALNFFFIIFKKKKIFVINSKNLLFYIHLPVYVKIKKIQCIFYFFLVKEIRTFKTFVYFFYNWMQNIEMLLTRKIILKGLGLKAFFNEATQVLSLKVGFSHSILFSTVFINLKIQIIKNVIILRGFCLDEVTTFLNKLKMIKKPNVYKGKGLWYKGEQLKLKAIKKA